MLGTQQRCNVCFAKRVVVNVFKNKLIELNCGHFQRVNVRGEIVDYAAAPLPSAAPHMPEIKHEQRITYEVNTDVLLSRKPQAAKPAQPRKAPRSTTRHTVNRNTLASLAELMRDTDKGQQL